MHTEGGGEPGYRVFWYFCILKRVCRSLPFLLPDTTVYQYLTQHIYVSCLFYYMISDMLLQHNIMKHVEWQSFSEFYDPYHFEYYFTYAMYKLTSPKTTIYVVLTTFQVRAHVWYLSSIHSQVFGHK